MTRVFFCYFVDFRCIIMYYFAIEIIDPVAFIETLPLYRFHSIALVQPFLFIFILLF